MIEGKDTRIGKTNEKKRREEGKMRR